MRFVPLPSCACRCNPPPLRAVRLGASGFLDLEPLATAHLQVGFRKGVPPQTRTREVICNVGRPDHPDSLFSGGLRRDFYRDRDCLSDNPVRFAGLLLVLKLDADQGCAAATIDDAETPTVSAPGNIIDRVVHGGLLRFWARYCAANGMAKRSQGFGSDQQLPCRWRPRPTGRIGARVAQAWLEAGKGLLGAQPAPRVTRGRRHRREDMLRGG
jgi:hypothetical protein